jgi:hypothetical protein
MKLAGKSDCSEFRFYLYILLSFSLEKEELNHSYQIFVLSLKKVKGHFILKFPRKEAVNSKT